jgi:peptidoglycan/LPS O-acetylase OafA/YrhL
VGEGPSANLDLLRAVAVLLVLAQHLCRRMQVDQVSWIPTSSLGRFGVLLFFVHTCFVLMYSMQRSGLTGWPLLKNFHTRRIFRIYPLSIIAVLTALALHLDSNINGVAGLSYGPFPGKRVLVSNLLLVQNLVSAKSMVNVLWSLPFELQMYLFLPLIFLWIRRKRRFWPLLALWTVSAIAGTVQPHIHQLQSLSILRFVPNFLPGVIAYVLPQVPRIKSFLWPVFMVGLVGAYTLHPTERMGWILCLILGLLIPSFVEIASAWVRWISNRIATYSYGIYLSHQFCIWIALGLLASHSLWLKIPVFIGLFAALPIVLYHTIEKPMINVGVQLAKRWSRQETARVRPARLTTPAAEPNISPAD